MNAVFTITSKNYLSRALCLGRSVRKYSDVDFYIFLADEMEEELLREEDHLFELIEFRQIRPELLPDMAFKYNILEFNTSIKPFCFQYLFEKKLPTGSGYERVIYFDPDILVYGDVEQIFTLLEHKSIILTPHILTAEEECSGCSPERGLLFSGAYNLGFTAIKGDETGKRIVSWWGRRLEKECYADAYTSLHTDQKWMDLVPAYFGDKVLISRQLGMNFACWNLHERLLYQEETKYLVKNRITGGEGEPLIFFHFSGFDPAVEGLIHNRQSLHNLRNHPELVPIFSEYRELLYESGYEYYIHMGYAYDCFENGVRITACHRRMYRSLTEKGYQTNNPFAVGKDSWYELLKASGLVREGLRMTYDKATKGTVKGFGRKDRILKRLLVLMKCLMGTERFLLLMRWLGHAIRPEDQLYLLKGIPRGLCEKG